MPIAKLRCDAIISYEIINSDKKDKILLLHGWGANKELMQRAFKDHLNDFCQIYVDLPGFGGSSIDVALDSTKYALIILEFLQAKNLNPNIIIGHSFGGKIASLLKCDMLVLLASAGIKNKKSLKTRLKLRFFKILKRLHINKLFKNYFLSKDAIGLNEFMYDTFKNVIKENFEYIFKNIKTPTLIFWGDRDEATPLKNGLKINKLIKNSKFYPLKGDHFAFLHHSDFIANKIKENYKND